MTFQARDWRDQAACTGHDPELWFPQTRRTPATTQAKRICAGCPVRGECLAFALDNRIEHGIWGGLTERASRAARRGRATGVPVPAIAAGDLITQAAHVLVTAMNATAGDSPGAPS